MVLYLMGTIMSSIKDKDKSYKIAFRSNKERNNLVSILKKKGFDIDTDYTKNECYLFLTTFDNMKLGGWDNREIYNEKCAWHKRISLKSILKMCKES